MDRQQKQSRVEMRPEFDDEHRKMMLMMNKRWRLNSIGWNSGVCTANGVGAKTGLGG